MSGIEIIRPKDRAAWLRARGKDVTASVVGALFDAHDFTTRFELWALKSGRVRNDEGENPAMRRGRLLEKVAVDILREDYPAWSIHHNAAENTYYREPAARLGGTPDCIVEAPGRGRGIIQIKSVEASVFRKKWIDEDGNVEPPLWIALQATLEAYLVPGAVWAAVAPLVVGHGLEMPLVEVPLVDGVIDAMKAKAAEFWAMVESGVEPQPDYQRDSETIGRLYAQGDEYHEVDLSGDNRIPDLLAARRVLGRDAKDAREAIAAIDTEIKSKMGRAQIAHIAGGEKITWKPFKRAGFFDEPLVSRALRYPAERD